MKERLDRIRRKCVAWPITTAIIAEVHEIIAEGQFSANLTLYKILTTLYWWSMMKKNVYLYCKQCNILKRIGPKVSKHVHPMNCLMPTEVLQWWGLDFMGPIEFLAKHTKNRYIITATDHTTKWVEARILENNIIESTAKFLYEKIITRFGCPI